MSEELKACGEFIQAAMDGDDAQCERLFQQDAVVHAIATWGVRRTERRILGTCDFDLHPHYENGRGTSCHNWKPSISDAPLGTSLPETAPLISRTEAVDALEAWHDVLPSREEQATAWSALHIIRALDIITPQVTRPDCPTLKALGHHTTQGAKLFAYPFVIVRFDFCPDCGEKL